MRSVTRFPAMRPAAIVGAGFVFLFIYAGLLGINLENASRQVPQIEALALLDSSATSLRGQISNFIFIDGRFASRREMSPDQFVRLEEIKERTFRNLTATVAELETFVGRADGDSIQKFLEGLNATSARRVALQEKIYDPQKGLTARFSATRSNADEVFTRVSESVPLPTADYLTSRTAQNEFLGNLSADRSRAALEALMAFKKKIAEFPGLTPEQRHDLTVSADANAKAFSDLANANIEFRAIGEAMRAQVVTGDPEVARLERDVHRRASTLRSDQADGRRRLELGTAGIGILATLAFGWLAFSAYRRVRLRDRSLRDASQRFLDFARASSDVFWEIAADGRVHQIFGNLRPFFGNENPPDEMKLEDWATQLGLDIASLRETLKAQLPFRDLDHFIISGWSQRWYATAGVPVFDSNGTFLGLRCASREVTEEKSEAAARQLAELRLAAIAENLPITLFRVEGSRYDARFAFVGANAAKILGRTQEELMSRPLHHDHWFVMEEDQARFSAEISRGLDEEGLGTSRARVRLPDGSIRWVQQISRRVPRPHPAAAGAVEGLWIDVTEEENRLRQITDFAEAIDSVSQAIYIVQRDTREINYANKGYMRLFGLSEGDMKQRRYVGQLGAPVGLSIQELSSQVEADVDSPEGWHGEFSYRLNDGRIKHFLGHSRPLRDARRIMVLTDITERVEQERQVSGFRAALDHAGDGIVIFADQDKPIVYANNAIRRILRLPEGVSLEGRFLHEFIPTRRDQYLEIRSFIMNTLDADGNVDAQREGLRADGTPIISHLRATKLPDGRVLLAVTDVTQRAYLEREVQARREELARLVSTLPGVAYRLEWADERYIASFISPRIADFSGYADQTTLDASPAGTALISENDARLRTQAMADARMKGGAYEIVWRMLTRSSEVRWVMERGEHIIMPDGSLMAEGYLTDVTSRITYEAELERSREQSALIMRALNTAEEVVAMLDTEDRYIFINQAGVRLLGVSRQEDVIGRHQKDFLRYEKDTHRQSFKQMRDALAENRQWRGEMITARRDGTEQVLRAFVARNIDGPTIVLASDVTSEARARRASERRARVMSDLGTDKDLQLLDMAEAMGRIARAASEGLDIPLTSIWLFSERAADMMALMAYDTRTGLMRSGLLVSMKDHDEYLANLSARRPIIAPVVEEHPALKGFTENYFMPAGVRSAMNIPIVRDNRTIGVLTCEDTTPHAEWLAEEVQFAAHIADFAALILESIARRKTLNELGHANRRLSDVVRALDSAYDRILVQDSDRNVTYANRGALDLIGVGNLREIAGKRTIDVLLSHIEGIGTVADEFRTAAAAGIQLNREIEFISPRYGRRSLEVRVSSLDGGGLLYAATDVTERKERDAEQQLLRRQLSDAQRLEAIGSLAGGIAHDFNNIIGATRGFADLLVSDLPPNTDSRRYAERIVASSRRAAALVKEIMAFSRVKDAEHTPVAVFDLMNEAEDILLSRPDKSLRLIAANTAEDAWIDANATQMSQVLSNLLINAADAMGATGTINLNAEVIRADVQIMADFTADGIRKGDDGLLATTQGTVNPKTPYVRFAVIDEGSGIASSVLAHIFEPFYTTKEKSRGTGLGLAVVAGIVEAHAGAIRVLTRPGRGTTFEIYVPLGKEGRAVLAPRAQTAKTGDLHGRERVLIVDDESDLAESLAIALGRMGYETAPVFHPQEALEIFAEDPNAWDVVISDQAMPKLKGVDLIRKFKAVRPDLRTIVCTGYSDSLDADRAVLEGIDAFFHKPVTAETLARTIRGLFA